MEIRKIVCKSGTEYYLVNDSWETSRAWGHVSTLMAGKNCELEQEKITYINRTWECYTYQSVMFRVLEKYEKDLLNRYIESYKELNNVNRFKSGEKDKVIEEFYKTENGKDILEIRKRINEREFD